MNFNFNKNQYLLFVHEFLYSLFSGISKLGWVYLYLEGVSLITILIALFSYRLLLNFVFTPLVHFVLKHWTFKPVAFMGIILQAAFLGSFYFAPQGLFFLSLTVILMAAYDSFYWTSVVNIERLVPQSEDIANNIGWANAIAVLAGASSAILAAYGLYSIPEKTFLIAVIGMLTSFVPISFMKLAVPPPQGEGGVLQVMFLNKPIKQFFQNPLMLIATARGLVNEVIAVLPIFLVHFNLTLIDVGLIYGAMSIVSSVSLVLVGHYENGNRNLLSMFFGVSTMVLLLVFAFLPINQLPLFMLLYSVFGVSWQISIHAINQKFCHQYWPCANGGILNQLLDNTGSNLLYPILFLFLIISVQDMAKVVHLMFIFAASIVVAVLIIEPRARQKLAELSL